MYKLGVNPQPTPLLEKSMHQIPQIKGSFLPLLEMLSARYRTAASKWTISSRIWCSSRTMLSGRT